MTLLFFKAALAKEINCFSLKDKLFPFLLIWKFNLLLLFKISLNKLKESKISKISFSLYLFKGSIFSFKLPSKIKGSFGIIVIFCLKESKLILLISVSSIKIFPSKLSIILHNDNIKVDFPLKFFPIIPTFSLGLIIKFIFFKMIGEKGLYLVE